jgi:hypothetical protein
VPLTEKGDANGKGGYAPGPHSTLHDMADSDVAASIGTLSDVNNAGMADVGVKVSVTTNAFKPPTDMPMSSGWSTTFACTGGSPYTPAQQMQSRRRRQQRISPGVKYARAYVYSHAHIQHAGKHTGTHAYTHENTRPLVHGCQSKMHPCSVQDTFNHTITP